MFVPKKVQLQVQAPVLVQVQLQVRVLNDITVHIKVQTQVHIQAHLQFMHKYTTSTSKKSYKNTTSAYKKIGRIKAQVLIRYVYK